MKDAARAGPDPGGTHAYLDAFAVRRFARGRPQATSREVALAYLRYLPRESFAGSCVFHGANGCGLPRSLRASACRNKLCEGVAELQRRIQLDGAKRFFLAAIDEAGVARSLFAREG